MNGRWDRRRLLHRGHAHGPVPSPPIPPSPTPGLVVATSEDGRFVLFDAEATDAPPEQPPWDAWLSHVTDDGTALGWDAGSSGVRHIRVAVGGGPEDAISPDAEAGAAEIEPLTGRGRLQIRTGRLCVAGLDEAFAARNAELHPGAFGDVIEIDPGEYEVETARVRWRNADAIRAGIRARTLRRGDELVVGLVQRGIPAILVVTVLVAVSILVGAFAARDVGPMAITIAIVAGAAVLAAWAVFIRAGAAPPLRRVSAARRAMLERLPDGIVVLRRARD